MKHKGYEWNGQELIHLNTREGSVHSGWDEDAGHWWISIAIPYETIGEPTILVTYFTVNREPDGLVGAFKALVNLIERH